MLNRGRARSSIVAAGFVLLVPLLGGASVPPPARTAESAAPVHGHAALAVHSAVSPTPARPGDRVRQTARVTNTGNVPLFAVVAQLGPVASEPCVRGAPWLKPGEDVIFSCHGQLPESHRMTARVHATGRTGQVVSAADTTEVPAPLPPPPAPSPRVTLSLGQPEPVPAAGAYDVPVTVRNPSRAQLSEVKVTGQPPECRRIVGDLAPDQSMVYRCRVQQGSTVALLVSARSGAGDTSADGELELPPIEQGQAPVPPPVAEPPPPASDPPPLPEPPAERPESTSESSGPLDSPQRAAGFISVLAALVMMISVGALSTATRPGK